MNIQLLHHTPLHIASAAIRKCWASEDKSDTTEEMISGLDYYIDETNCQHSGGKVVFLDVPEAGLKDKELINRVGNKFKHKSTLRHVHYTFDCNDVSTKTLLALTRHCIGKEISVQSTRYTTAKRKDELSYTHLSKPERNEKLDRIMSIVHEAIDEGWGNDDLSMLLPQAYNYSFVMTMNIESLQWFLQLRTKKDAHWDIQALAHALAKQIPEEHRYLFEDFIYRDPKLPSGAKYLKRDHPVLFQNRVYKVYDQVTDGYRLHTDTGFVGVSSEDVELIYTKEE
jgi:thymidylate synthase (FAD)